MRKSGQPRVVVELRKFARSATLRHMTTLASGEQVPQWTVGDRLRKARELLDIDQGPFAALIGVSRGTVSNYERGLTERYKPIVMNAWAAHTGVPVEWLEHGEQPAGPTPPDGGGRETSDKLDALAKAKRQRVGGSRTTHHYSPHLTPEPVAA